MNIFRVLVINLFLIMSLDAMALDVTSNIKALRMFPEAQPVVAARNNVVFSLDDAFVTGCDLLYVSKNDKATISLLLAAKLSSTPIKVYYNTDPSPWHSGTCTAVEVSLQ